MVWKDLRKRFQILLKITFGNIFQKQTSLPARVQPEEKLSRFLTSDNHHNSSQVTYGAFMPRSGETSVFRTTKLCNKEIWLIADEQILPNLPKGRKLHGRGEVEAQNVFALSLKAEPETSKHFRHANIINWPVDNSKQRLIAGELALKANRILVGN